MINDQNRVYDGWLSLEGGVDAGRAPNMIDANQCVSAINMTFRGGSAKTRPGFRILNEQFPDEGVTPPLHQLWCFNDQHQYNPTSDTWIFSVNLNMQDPGPGNIRANSHYWTQLNQFAIATFSDTGHDGLGFFRLLNAGNTVFMVDQGLPMARVTPTIYARFKLIAKPIDHGTWFLFQVDHPDLFAGAGPANGEELKVMFPDFGLSTDLHIQGEYKRSGTSLSNPDPPYEPMAPWFVNENSEYVYRNGKMQCAIRYSPHNGQDCIMAMVGGRLFKIIPGVTDAKVNEVLVEDAPRNLRNMKRMPIAYMVQADKWMVAQDGVSAPILYDGNKARRAMPSADVDHTEVPVGTIMAYGMGRISVVVQERDVAFGDLYGSHDLPDPADSLILFTERNFLAEGFDAAIPFEQGKATGAIFFPQLDTSTGNGQLMVFSERGASSFFLSLPREQWKTSEFQILALLTTGLRGHRSIAVVNEDLWFRADDGVRSFRQARSEQTGWAHIPLSTNVRQYTDNDSDFLLKYASAIYFDNRIIFTTSPMWHQGRPIHYGMLVVDFDILSSFGGKFNPAWEGQWTVFHPDTPEYVLPSQLLTGTFDGVARAFMFGVNLQNQNQLYELSMDDKDDWNYQPIQWEFESRTLDFMKMTQNPMPFSETELYDGDVWLKEIEE